MKYVLLGSLAAGAMKKQASRTTNARAKLSQLGIKIECVYYTQGGFDFVDVVDAPSAEAMLAFSVWYAEQGYGKITSCPAYEEREMVRALHRAGVRGRPSRAGRGRR
ncbi:MAG: GYD domain-containing protein [Alphaproteobacteria bacterium]|nr:GYD domain-containing protein [Alphaproteobacteria bacterium]